VLGAFVGALALLTEVEGYLVFRIVGAISLCVAGVVVARRPVSTGRDERTRASEGSRELRKPRGGVRLSVFDRYGAFRWHPWEEGHSVETELVALDVLHHDARLVVVIGKQ
jgi:hypothetical protein